MGAIPGTLDAEAGPPMTVPLRHFVVGLGFLLVGVLLGVGQALDVLPGFGRLAHVHVLLVGWICVTIMGAMTQFVPVWSGATLHSRRLASVQLVLVGVGVTGFASGLLAGALAWLPAFGASMLIGFWTFVYNVGRTLVTVDGYDVTERHFLLSLGFFTVLTVLGVLLAVDLASTLPGAFPGHANLVGAHATLAVFGAILTTVYGALYQLGTMFTQTELHGADTLLRRVEEIGHPLGVVLLATGRLFDWVTMARVGGGFVLIAAVAIAAVLARKLSEMRVDRTPMHSRYALAVVALLAWAIASVPAWVDDPTAPVRRFGTAGSAHLLVLGAIGFVVFGTLYHVVPFVVWVHRYADRLGLDDVPTIDDLYDDRLAVLDATFLASGTALLVTSDWLHVPARTRPIGGALLVLGVIVFGANLLLVIRRHGPRSVTSVVLGRLADLPARRGGSA